VSSKKPYANPFFWWGPAWARADWRSIGDLLRAETLAAADAALLWAALVRRRSVAVIAGPSGAGKSTLLGALLDFLPVDTRPVFVRGSFETFDFLADPELTPERAALVVNEISSHFPFYLWGPAVAHLLDAAERGYMVLATAHAESVPAFLAFLTRPPLRIPARRVALLEFVVLLGRDTAEPHGRRVSEIWRMSPARLGVAIERLSPRDDTFPPPFPDEELATRAALLRRLRSGEIADARELRALATGNLPTFPVEPLQTPRVASAQAHSPVRQCDATLVRQKSRSNRQH
jgi:hypothetical protein